MNRDIEFNRQMKEIKTEIKRNPKMGQHPAVGRNPHFKNNSDLIEHRALRIWDARYSKLND